MRRFSCAIIVKRVSLVTGHPITEVLLQFKRLSNLWEFPGGKLDGNETTENCACRELNEETGLLWIDGRQLFWVNHGEFECTVWECTRYNGEATVKEPDKQSAIGWFDINKLPHNLAFYTKNCISAGALTR